MKNRTHYFQQPCWPLDDGPSLKIQIVAAWIIYLLTTRNSELLHLVAGTVTSWSSITILPTLGRYSHRHTEEVWKEQHGLLLKCRRRMKYPASPRGLHRHIAGLPCTAQGASLCFIFPVWITLSSSTGYCWIELSFCEANFRLQAWQCCRNAMCY